MKLVFFFYNNVTDDMFSERRKLKQKSPSYKHIVSRFLSVRHILKRFRVHSYT